MGLAPLRYRHGNDWRDRGPGGFGYRPIPEAKNCSKKPAAPLVGGGRLVVVGRRLLNYRSNGWVSATG